MNTTSILQVMYYNIPETLPNVGKGRENSVFVYHNKQAGAKTRWVRYVAVASWLIWSIFVSHWTRFIQTYSSTQFYTSPQSKHLREPWTVQAIEVARSIRARRSHVWYWSSCMHWSQSGPYWGCLASGTFFARLGSRRRLGAGGDTFRVREEGYESWEFFWNRLTYWQNCVEN